MPAAERTPGERVALLAAERMFTAAQTEFTLYVMSRLQDATMDLDEVMRLKTAQVEAYQLYAELLRYNGRP